jgi:hypothetical protein
MNEIQFAFEVTQDDYAEANALICRKLKWKRSWIVPLLGVAVMAVPFLQVDADGYINPHLGSLWIVVVGGFALIYYGVRYQSARYIARQHYPSTGIEHHRFTAIVSDGGIKVRGTFSEWKYGWPAILLAEESEKLFALYTGLQIFVFAKRHLNDEQTNALRSLIAAQPKFEGGTIPKY